MISNLNTLPQWMSDTKLDLFVEQALLETGSEFDLQYWREFIDGHEDTWAEQAREFLLPLGITVTDCRECDDADELEWLVEGL